MKNIENKIWDKINRTIPPIEEEEIIEQHVKESWKLASILISGMFKNKNDNDNSK